MSKLGPISPNDPVLQHVERLRKSGQTALAAEIASLIDESADEATRMPASFTIPEIRFSSLKPHLASRKAVTKVAIFIAIFLVFGFLVQTLSATLQATSAVIGWVPKLLRSEHLQNAAMIGVSENPYFYLELSQYYAESGKLDRARTMAILGLKMAGPANAAANEALEAQLEKLE